MSDDVFKQRVANLRLHGILAHWSQLATTDWLPQLVTSLEVTRLTLTRHLLRFSHLFGCHLRGGNVAGRCKRRSQHCDLLRITFRLRHPQC